MNELDLPLVPVMWLQLGQPQHDGFAPLAVVAQLFDVIDQPAFGIFALVMGV